MSEDIDFNRLAIDTAAKSKANKRKVGCVIVDTLGKRYAANFNYHPDDFPCELEDGTTDPMVIHAEVAALSYFYNLHGEQAVPTTCYVTQPPCAICQGLLQEAGITDIIVVEEFMKFDTEKLQYDLIPVSATKGLAKILTYGARKYKANNWRKGDIKRYEAAAFRHFDAWRAGEKIDEESGYLHLEHLLCNVAFLLELDKSESE